MFTCWEKNKNLTKESPKNNNKHMGLWKIPFRLPNNYKAERNIEAFTMEREDMEKASLRQVCNSNKQVYFPPNI